MKTAIDLTQMNKHTQTRTNSFLAVKVTADGKVVTPPGQLVNAQRRTGLLQQSNLLAEWVHLGTNWALSVVMMKLRVSHQRQQMDRPVALATKKKA